VTPTTLGDISREHRRSYPGSTAVVDGQYRLTWPEFDDRINRTAHALQAAGVGEGDASTGTSVYGHRVHGDVDL